MKQLLHNSLKILFILLLLSFSINASENIDNYHKLKSRVHSLKTGHRKIYFKVVENINAQRINKLGSQMSTRSFQEKIVLKKGSFVFTKKESLTKNRSSLNNTKNNFPVLRDSSNRLVVILDNIIIYFKKDLSENDIDNWTKKNNLKILKKLSDLDNSYLIAYPAQISTIDLCNKLQEHPEVIVATPDMWREQTLK